MSSTKNVCLGLGVSLGIFGLSAANNTCLSDELNFNKLTSNNEVLAFANSSLYGFLTDQYGLSLMALTINKPLNSHYPTIFNEALKRVSLMGSKTIQHISDLSSEQKSVLINNHITLEQGASVLAFNSQDQELLAKSHEGNLVKELNEHPVKSLEQKGTVTSSLAELANVEIDYGSQHGRDHILKRGSNQGKYPHHGHDRGYGYGYSHDIDQGKSVALASTLELQPLS